MGAVTTLQSNYFQLEQLAEGVYAAIINQGTGPIGNAGLIDLGGRTLVWDTFQIPQAALDLRRMAEELFNRPVTTVVNSHFHLDHVGGNQVFADCDIYATAKTRDMVAQRTPQVLEFCRANLDFPDRIAKQAQEEQDPVRKKELELQVSDMREFGAALETFHMTLPNVVFENALTFHGTKRTAQLLCHGGGHSPSDTVLYLPDDEVLFIGDLVTIDSHLLIRDGSAAEWLQILEKLEDLPIRHVVSGHGPVAGKEYLQVGYRYVSHVISQAERLLQEGAPAEKAEELQMPAEYAEWRLEQLYQQNIKSWHERLKEEQGK